MSVPSWICEAGAALLSTTGWVQVDEQEKATTIRIVPLHFPLGVLWPCLWVMSLAGLSGGLIWVVFMENLEETGFWFTLLRGILFFTLMGAYIGQNNATELLLLVAMGFVATILRFADYPLAPLLIGFILGPMLEDNFARSMQLYDGIGFILQRPMTMGLLALALFLILLPSLRARRAAIRASGTADGD